MKYVKITLLYLVTVGFSVLIFTGISTKIFHVNYEKKSTKDKYILPKNIIVKTIKLTE